MLLVDRLPERITVRKFPICLRFEQRRVGGFPPRTGLADSLGLSRYLTPQMNFFGHAVVACGQSAEPGFVLGAMLPDLVGMAGVRVTAVLDERLALGVALHHETDRRFHSAPDFRTLCESAVTTLEAQGVGRGAARAVGHVGSELLLDGALSGDRSARGAYAAALDLGLQDGLLDRIRLKPGHEATHLARMLRRLSNAPLPEGYQDPDFVYERLHAILVRRPRIALHPADEEPVKRWLRGAAPRLLDCAASLLAAAG